MYYDYRSGCIHVHVVPTRPEDAGAQEGDWGSCKLTNPLLGTNPRLLGEQQALQTTEWALQPDRPTCNNLRYTLINKITYSHIFFKPSVLSGQMVRGCYGRKWANGFHTLLKPLFLISLRTKGKRHFTEGRSGSHPWLVTPSPSLPTGWHPRSAIRRDVHTWSNESYKCYFVSKQTLRSVFYLQ